MIDAIRQAYVTFWSPLYSGALLQQAALFIGGAALFFVIRELRGGRRKIRVPSVVRYVIPREQNGHPTARVDRWNWILTWFWVPPFRALESAVWLTVAGALSAYLASHFGARAPLFDDAAAIAIFQGAVIFIGTEFFQYWQHRLLHEVPFLWNFHRGHHSAEALNFFTAMRNHPGEWLYTMVYGAIYTFIMPAVVIWFTGSQMLPVTFFGLVYLKLITELVGVLCHSHVPLSLGKLDYILNTPVMHQIHHSAELRHRDRNYGATLMIFDWMFGTLYQPSRGETFRFGLNDEEWGENNPHRTVRGFYLDPFRRLWR
jgi:sterol desaturase/sphingolipid hydroxylase (fatty acid hydroxylase superfamily)